MDGTDAEVGCDGKAVQRRACRSRPQASALSVQCFAAACADAVAEFCEGAQHLRARRLGVMSALYSLGRRLKDGGTVKRQRGGRSQVHRLVSRSAVIVFLTSLVPAAAFAAVTLSGGARDPSPRSPGTELTVRGSVASDAGCTRPYSDASPWNTRIGARPSYHPRSARFVGRIGGPLTSDPTQYTYPVYPVAADTPLRSVQVSGLFSNVSDEQTLDVQSGGSVRLPIPDGAVPAAGSDAQIIMVNRATGDEWGAWKLRRSGGGWQTTNGYHYNTRWSGVPPHEPGGRPFSSRGAGVPYLAGLVRPCELARGRIEHALAFAYTAPAPSHVYPATKSDGAGSEGLDVPEGTRLQLDPALTVAQINAFGCRGPCLTIARALQEYGMYTIDNSGASKVMLEYETTARWNGAVGRTTVSPIPVSAFKVLERVGAPAADAPTTGGPSCTIRGTPRADTLAGTPADDVICGMGGDDRIYGRAGNDRLYGGAGRDRLFGGAGRDRLHGDAGNDRIDGGAGNDRLYGGAGGDRIRGGRGRDLLSGGADHDVLLSRDRDRDLVRGGPGRDRATVDRRLDVLSSIRRATGR